MITICPPTDETAKLTAKAKYKQGQPYRLSDQCVAREAEDGLLLYHTLTAELLLLDFAEADALHCLPGSVPEELKELLPRRFLISADTDERLYCDQLRRVLSMTKEKDEAVTSYTVFTTTDCNARCFYCYEKGRSRIPMSEETARATAEYIAKHCNGKPVRFHWFGGEPLFNTPAIDTIVAGMKENNIPYSSSMISNGYLFDEELVRKAKEEWRLKKVQITLDGTEDIYNRRKAYIYREGSAYQRVLRNIGLLLEAEVRVSVRLNLDMNNQKDLFALVDELADRFADKKGLSVYNHIIFEKPENPRSEEERKALYQVSDDLTTHIVERGMGGEGGVPRAFRTSWCMADNDSSVTILPDGRLGKCEHYSESEIWGDLWSDERDEKLLSDWKKRIPFLSECRACFLYPRCIRLIKCPNHYAYCDPEYREGKRKQLQRQMLHSYEKWKARAQTEEEQNVIDC